MPELLSQTRSHQRSLFDPRGDRGDDVFTLDIPAQEVFAGATLTEVESRRGGRARIVEQPLAGQSGRATLRVQWLHDAFGRIRYRLTAASRPAFDVAPADPAWWESIAATLAAGHENGVHGAYLKRVGGRVLFACNERLVFDPASTIKILPYAHAHTRIRAGDATLTTTIPVPGNLSLPQPAGVNCPFDEVNSAADTLPLTLRKAFEAMMIRSRNAPTEAVRRHFGAANVSATAQALGMTDTRYDAAPGCGQNQTTLVDLGKLYEGAAMARIALDWDQFVEHAWHAPIPEVDGVVSSMQIPVGFVDTYRSKVVNVNKSGSGGDSTGQKTSLAGYIGLPFRARQHGAIGERGYVYGIFIDKATKIASAFSSVAILMEMLRPEIAESVESLTS